MLVKLILPEGGKVLSSDGNEMVIKLPTACGSFQKAVTVISVKGSDLDDLADNSAADLVEILVNQRGKLRTIKI